MKMITQVAIGFARLQGHYIADREARLPA